jgi:hypothetical protein
MMVKEYTLYNMNISLNEILTYDLVSQPGFIETEILFLEENKYIRKIKIRKIFKIKR